MLDEWFRNDLMGLPGDEDGLEECQHLYVFSMLGFYPITPGLPIYVIGTPMFERAVIEQEPANHSKSLRTTIRRQINISNQPN